MLAAKQAQKSCEASSNGISSAFTGAFKKIGVAAAAAFSVKAITAFSKECIELGSDLTEVQNVVDVTFGQSASKINAWAKTTATAFGISELSTKQYSGTMGAMLKSMGLTTDSALDMSTKITELAGDLASFYNLDVDEAFTKIRSGISGETEPLRQLGINMSVANLEAYALSKGITTSYQKMSQSNQALLRYNYLLSVTADAQGDFSRTSDSWANQVKILQLNFDSLKSSVGQLLITALTPLLKQLNQLIAYANRAASAIASLFSGQVATATAGLSSAADTASESIASTGDAATKAAKKAKNAFAQFDEINVLKTSDDSDTGTSDTGTSGAGAASGYSSALSDSLSSASTQLSSFFDPLVGAWNSKGKPLVDSIHNAFAEIKEFCEEIGLSFANIWNNGTAQTTLELILSIITDIFNIVGNIAEAFSNAWKKASTGDKIIQNIADAVNDVLFVTDDVGKSVSEWWQGERGQSFAAAITACFEKITNAIKRVTAALREVWENGGEELFNNLQDLFGNLGEIISIVIGYIADMYADLVEWFAPDAEAALGGVNDAFDVINDVLEWLKTDGEPILEAFSYAIGMLTAGWLAYKGVVLATSIAQKAYAAVQAIVNAVMNANPVMLVVTGIIALIAVIVTCIKHWDEIKAAGSAAWEGIKSAWETVSTWFKTNVIDPLVSTFENLWSSICSIFNNVKDFFKNKFNEAWTAVKGVFSGVGSFFSGIWNTIKSKFTTIGTNIGNAIGGAFKKVVNSIISFAQNTINGFIKAINKAINLINKIPGVNISLIKELTIPKLATGGYVEANNPQLAIVGDNKREGEIVTPESKIREQVRLALSDIGAAVNSGIQTIKLQIELHIKYPDGRTVIKQINEAQIAEGKILLNV